MSKTHGGEKHEFLDQIRFSRGLGLWRAMSRGMTVVAATLVFVLLGEATSAAGSFTPLAILLVALLMVVNSLGYTELALSMARPGGAYTLVHKGQENAGLAFITGWTLTVAGIGLCGLLARGAAQHLNLLLANVLNLSVPASILGMGIVALVAFQSCMGGKIGRRLGHLMVLATIRSDQAVEQETIDNLAVMLSEQLDRPLSVEMVVLPVIRSGNP